MEQVWRAGERGLHPLSTPLQLFLASPSIDFLPDRAWEQLASAEQGNRLRLGESTARRDIDGEAGASRDPQNQGERGIS